jgi:hypothetical protein
MFADAGFAGCLASSKSTSGGILCLVGKRTFVPLTWICKKQTAISHSSAEAEVIALDAAVRMEGIPCLTLWSTILKVFIGEGDRSSRLKPPSHANNHNTMEADILSSIDYVKTNIDKPHPRARLIIMEDNDGVIKMCIKGRSPNMRHCARVHRIDLDWMFERIREDPGISIQYINTKDQIADIFTKGQFTSDQWHKLCRLAQLGPRTAQPEAAAHFSISMPRFKFLCAQCTCRFFFLPVHSSFEDAAKRRPPHCAVTTNVLPGSYCEYVARSTGGSNSASR